MVADKKISVSIEQAQNLIRHKSRLVDEGEEVDIIDAQGRILAEDILAGFNNPPFDKSPLDGYAVRSQDVAGASPENPVILTVIDGICAGSVSDLSVTPGTAVRLMTGAPMPEGSDCVIKQEDTELDQEGRVRILKAVGHHENYCFAGEDFKKGDLVLVKGHRLTFVEIGIIASLGITRIKVMRRPRAAVISTGDEVVMPGQPLEKGKIYDSNLYMITAALKAAGAEIICMQQANDDSQFIADLLKKNAEKADVIVTTGGVSVGQGDCIPEALDLAGATTLFNHIKVKPGSPSTFSLLGDVPVISLTGSPFGAAVNFNLLVKPALAAATGDDAGDVRYGYAVFRGSFGKSAKNTRYIKGILADGTVTRPQGSDSNGIIGNMGGCNCYIEIPAGTKSLEDGTRVKVINI